jgi:hypothetical protein
MKTALKIRFYILIFFLNTCSVFAGTLPYSTGTDSVLINKNFNLLSLMNKDKVRLKLIRDATLKGISARQSANLKAAIEECNSVDCYANALQFTKAEIVSAGDALLKLYKKKKAVKQLVADLRQEGYYTNYQKLNDTAFLRATWNNAASGVNYIIDVYVKGKAPRYPKIDAISYDTGAPAFKQKIKAQLMALSSADRNRQPFFELPLGLAMRSLQINGRDEAARYEPLNGGMNKLPYDKIKSINWHSYPYSMILVPGLGPETPGVALDPQGVKRCEMGIERYRKGLAPFIVVSGGHVHPNKTPYCEAVEMKKYMVEQLGVPADVIFIEPHARHTTTNLRNTNRMVYRFGIPADKTVLFVTYQSQSEYILKFEKKCVSELGYTPYQKLKKISEVETEYFPVKESLHSNPIEPLDP